MSVLFASRERKRSWRDIALELTQEMDSTRIKELTTELLQALTHDLPRLNKVA